MRENLLSIIKKTLHNQLNKKQVLALEKIISFIEDKISDEIFILKGYAGTGKTYIISNIVNISI